MPENRAKPPHRRHCITVPVEWPSPDGTAPLRFHLSVGFNPLTGNICEVFYADGQRGGSQLQHIITDTCVLISLAIQHGISIDDLKRSMGSVPYAGQNIPASVIGVIIELLSLERAAQC